MHRAMDAKWRMQFLHYPPIAFHHTELFFAQCFIVTLIRDFIETALSAKSKEWWGPGGVLRCLMYFISFHKNKAASSGEQKSPEATAKMIWRVFQIFLGRGAHFVTICLTCFEFVFAGSLRGDLEELRR